MASGGINFAVDADAWLPTIKAMRSLPAAVKREVARRGVDLAEPLAKEIRDAGRTDSSRHAQRVAGTVKAGMKGGVPSVTAGGLPYTMGSEFGAHHRYKKIRRNPTVFGRRVPSFSRRTTMQFRDHKPEGWWFSEPLRTGKGVDQVMLAWRDLVDDVIRTSF